MTKKKKKKRKSPLAHGDEYVRRTINRFVRIVSKHKKAEKSL